MRQPSPLPVSQPTRRRTRNDGYDGRSDPGWQLMHHQMKSPPKQAYCQACLRRAASCMRLLLFISLCSMKPGAFAHGGGLNAEGCHNNHKTGDYHCHRGPVELYVPSQRQFAPVDRTYALPQVPPRFEPTPPPCFVGPRGGTYTITPSGRKNYSGC